MPSKYKNVPCTTRYTLFTFELSVLCPMPTTPAVCNHLHCTTPHASCNKLRCNAINFRCHIMMHMPLEMHVL